MMKALGLLAIAGAVVPCWASVRVSEIGSVTNYAATDGRDAAMFGVTWCSSGTTEFSSTSNQHPILLENLYRLSIVDGAHRLEQIGMSWAYHAVVTPLNQGQCGTCTPAPAPFLGASCSSTDSASTVGTQSFLGPRSELNIATHNFPFPYGNPPIENALSRRLSFALSNVDPTVNQSRYFVESWTTHPAHPGSFSTGYRELTVGGTPTDRFFGLTGAFRPNAQVFDLWNDESNSLLTTVENGFGGIIRVACNATVSPGGLWHYEYAVLNVNSDRGVRSFRVPTHGAELSNVEFRAVKYHSGEPISTDDWEVTQAPGFIEWSTPSFEENPNANGLRWGSMYSFRFDTARGPIKENVRLLPFKQGSGLQTIFPLVVAPTLWYCPGDINWDLRTNAADLSVLLSNFGNPSSGNDPNHDGVWDTADLSILLSDFGCGP